MQPKLEIGRPDDKFEKEADAVADKVLMMPSTPAMDQPMTGNSNADGPALNMKPQADTPALQMKCEECEEEERLQMKSSAETIRMAAAAEEEEDTIQMKSSMIMRGTEEEEDAVQMKPFSGVMRQEEEDQIQMKPSVWRSPGGGGYASPGVSQQISSSKGRGRPLDTAVSTEMGSKIGADFSGVRIHTDSKAVQMSSALGAQAFTHGKDIYFNQGKYNPGSPSGKHLLAHELTHTVQQGAAIQTKPAISKTQPKIQPLLGIVRDRLNEYARYIPGWTLFTVIIGYNPLLGRSVERNGENLVGGLLELIPVFGVLLMNKLREHNILGDAFAWVRERLSSLDLSLNRLERTIDNAYEAMDFVRWDPWDYNMGVLRRHFSPLMDDVMTFVSEVGEKILQLIKDALMTALKAIADAFPGYPLLTKILGQDPLTGEEVVSTTAEKIEDFLILIGRERELEKMRQEGTLQQSADWLDAELAQLDFSFAEIAGLFETAWDAFSMEDLRDPVGAFNRTVAIFQPFVTRVFTFAANVAMQVLQFIKDALLSQLSAFAREQRGYHLLTVLLNQDPFTNERVPRSVENIIRGFMSLMDGGEAQFQQMKETGAIERTTERVNAAVEELGFNLGYIVGLFIELWNSFTIDDIFDPLGAFRRIVDTLAEPLYRLIRFVVRIVRIVIEVLLEIMNFPFETINSIISNASQAFEDIKRDPIGFLKNLLMAVKQGFVQFFDNILTHLLNGLRDWLFGELASAGIQPPADISFQSILGFVLDTLGISIDNVWERLALKIGPERVAQIRGAIDTLTGVWTFIKDVYERGPIAIWEYIQEQLSNLWNMVLDMIRNWIVTRIITQVTTRLLSMLDPTGIMAVVNGFIAFYRAVQSFIEKLREMLEIVNAFVAGVANIARGDISQAANFLENALARGVPVAIGFLANQVGLRGLGTRIAEMIEGLRERVNAAIDWLIDRALSAGNALLQIGRNVVESVVARFSNRVDFRSNAGISHELFFTEARNSPYPILVMASDNPLSLEQVIQNRLDNEDKRLDDDQRQSLQDALEKKRLLDDFIRDNTQNMGEGNQNTDTIRSDIQEKLNVIKGHLIDGDIDVLPTEPTNVTYSMDRGRAKMVKAEPLTKLPGNTTGSPAPGSPASPAGWQLASSVNSASYIIGEDGKPERTSDGSRLRLSKPFKRVHLLSHLLHGPAIEWNLVSALQLVNSTFLSSFEDDMKTKTEEEGANLTFQIVVNYYNEDQNDLEVLDDEGTLIGRGNKSDYPESFTVTRGEMKNDNSGYETETKGYPGTELPSVTGASVEYTMTFYESKIREAVRAMKDDPGMLKTWSDYYSSAINSRVRSRLGPGNMQRLGNFFRNEQARYSLIETDTINADQFKKIIEFLRPMTNAEIADSLGITPESMRNWRRRGVPSGSVRLIKTQYGDAFERAKQLIPD